MNDKIKINVEYEITPLRFANMKCPYCGQKINLMVDGKAENGEDIHDSVDLEFMQFNCPHCHKEIRTRGKKIEIKEV
jgi:predicted RNA-binding Zn-ribbon protein involved in translation (DUF1610 family)